MGEQIKPEEAKDNTDAPEEKKEMAEVLYSEDTKVESEQTESEATDEKPDEKEVEVSDENVESISYEDFTVPEGFGEVTEEAKSLFKDSSLSQEDAQKFVDYGSKIQKDTIDAMKSEQEKQSKAWADEVDKDLKAELPGAIDFVTKHTSKEFVSFLNETGLGNHPEMVRMMSKMSKATSEDSLSTAPSTAGEKAELTNAQVLYGDKYKQ